ncbi:hypothetical protein PHMEG_00040113 [Phytophthora megakarya]|uniref:Uncharacterized protein n=1 Tax=Phytophthora megakarya TaxID=4795 RepID=A0A225UEF4_9STRA|nr:hypothetical protein PHMEG_00040113 [Phytophthora megakarya]
MADDRAIFSGVWCILRSAGWISKLPQRSSLSDIYRYVPPGGNIEGLEGTDFFLGERSLLEHYRRVTIAPELYPW